MGGDPVPTPLNPEGLKDLSTETALQVMIKSLKRLEKSIKSERLRLTKELHELKAIKSTILEYEVTERTFPEP